MKRFESNNLCANIYVTKFIKFSNFQTPHEALNITYRDENLSRVADTIFLGLYIYNTAFRKYMSKNVCSELSLCAQKSTTHCWQTCCSNCLLRIRGIGITVWNNVMGTLNRYS